MADGTTGAMPDISAEDLIQIIRSLPDVVFQCYKDEDGKIRWSFNEGKLADEFRMRTAEIQGRSLDELFPPESVAVLKPEFEKAFEGEASEFVHTMGGRHFKHFPQPVRDEDGNVVSVVGFISEVTSLVEAEQEIRALNRQLAARVHELGAANQDLEAFSYTVSHDLRQPARAIQFSVEDARKALGGEVDASVASELDAIEAKAHLMQGLIDSVLNFSRAGWGPMSTGRVELSKLVRDVAEGLRKTDPGRDVDVVVAEDVVVSGDEGLLRLVLHNLFENAWRHTPAAGARIEFGVHQEGSEVQYFVRDNGSGFDPSMTDSMFQAFQHDADERGGTGIGLATVKRVVDRHGGRVWAESEPGEGATFWFTLHPTVA